MLAPLPPLPSSMSHLTVSGTQINAHLHHCQGWQLWLVWGAFSCWTGVNDGLLSREGASCCTILTRSSTWDWTPGSFQIPFMFKPVLMDSSSGRYSAFLNWFLVLWCCRSVRTRAEVFFLFYGLDCSSTFPCEAPSLLLASGEIVTGVHSCGLAVPHSPFGSFLNIEILHITK